MCNYYFNGTLYGRKFINEFGVTEFVTDEYMKRRVETKLITKILDFKIQV